jgi:spermidine synthase
VHAFTSTNSTEISARQRDERPVRKVERVDPRSLIMSGRSTYDAILLDVDNGPDRLTPKANDSLYTLPGLSAARTALTRGGVLAVWSSGSDRNFTQRLRRAGFRLDEGRVRANGTRGGAWHIIWVAIR